MPYGFGDEEEAQRDVTRADTALQSVREETIDPDVLKVPHKNIGQAEWEYVCQPQTPLIYFYADTGNLNQVFWLPYSRGKGQIVGVWKIDPGTGTIAVTPKTGDRINDSFGAWIIATKHDYIVLQDRAIGYWQVVT
jgi:hypothetical protein